jgi:hypothetical protein
VSAPTPIPKFATTRCMAKAGVRRSSGVKAAISVDWDGQKNALPTPASAMDRKPCHGRWTRAMLAYATVRTSSAADSIFRPPRRSTSVPPIGPATRLTPPFVPRISPAVPSEIPRTLWR